MSKLSSCDLWIQQTQNRTVASHLFMDSSVIFMDRDAERFMRAFPKEVNTFGAMMRQRAQIRCGSEEINIADFATAVVDIPNRTMPQLRLGRGCIVGWWQQRAVETWLRLISLSGPDWSVGIRTESLTSPVSYSEIKWEMCFSKYILNSCSLVMNGLGGVTVGGFGRKGPVSTVNFEVRPKVLLAQHGRYRLGDEVGEDNSPPPVFGRKHAVIFTLYDSRTSYS
ncbi:hypothetical protein F2P81_001258 [Scophthalmus maximus]|uniref:Uncharacterized protein n=1 Tax=Scophthalmus maximus TaxID=52904 RepID=A0A6A4TQT5_SCOMX|nr:hypothetical protein F2P81_001258 [Scophthalmus maximus]